MMFWKTVFQRKSRRVAVRTRGVGTACVALAAIALMTAVSEPAVAEDKITLKVAHLFQPELFVWKEGGQVMLDEIRKEAGDRVGFEVYPSGQLGKDMLSMLSSGLVDMAIFVPQYASDKLPLATVAELPGLYASSCQGTKKSWNISKPDGILGKGEFKANRMRVLWVNVLPPSVVMTTSARPTNMDALKGLKIRANGSAIKKVASELGAIPIQVSVGELYDSLSRGTVDGALYNYVAMPDFDLQRLLKYSVNGPQFGGNMIGLAISEASWEKLPADLQDIFARAASKAQDHLCAYEDEQTATVIEKFVKENGHTVIDLPAEETAKFEAKFNIVIDSWVKEMSSSGRDGQSVVDAMRE